MPAIYCRRCLDAAVSWHPEMTARKGGEPMPPPSSCATAPGSASLKCARCVKNGKGCEPLNAADRPVVVALFSFLAAGDFPQTKAEYQEAPTVQAVVVPARRVLHRAKFGDKSGRARKAAADAAAEAARQASEVAARAQLLEVTNLQVQIDIANNLRAITQALLLSRSASGVSMPVRVGPTTVPDELMAAEEESDEE